MGLFNLKLFTRDLNQAYQVAVESEGGRLLNGLRIIINAHQAGEDLDEAQTKAKGLPQANARELIRLARQVNDEVDEYLGSR